jgi:uncharacterized protein (DUF983 family)
MANDQETAMPDEQKQAKGWDGKCPNCQEPVRPEGFARLPVKQVTYHCGRCGWEVSMEFDLEKREDPVPFDHMGRRVET